MNKYYVTFGQIHTHVLAGNRIDKDCVFEFECANYKHACQGAFTLFGDKFCLCEEEMPDMKYYPRGIIKI